MTRLVCPRLWVDWQRCRLCRVSESVAEGVLGAAKLLAVVVVGEGKMMSEKKTMDDGLVERRGCREAKNSRAG